jgi:hypothetical protein
MTPRLARHGANSARRHCSSHFRRNYSPLSSWSGCSSGGHGSRESVADGCECGAAGEAAGCDNGAEVRVNLGAPFRAESVRYFAENHRGPLDPYMRGRMSAAKSYAKPVEVGATMVGATLGEVVASRDPNFSVGDIAVDYGGWQDYAVANGSDLRKLNPATAPVSTALGVLGMPGMTAYAGLLEIGRPQAGETVAVAAASGAVGSVVGQRAGTLGPANQEKQ